MKFVVRPAFWLDLERHHHWLTTHVSQAIAERWLAAVWQTVDFLGRNPQIGRWRRDLKFNGVRSWLVNSFRRWTIFYGQREAALVLYRCEGGQTDLRGLVIG